MSSSSCVFFSNVGCVTAEGGNMSIGSVVRLRIDGRTLRVQVVGGKKPIIRPDHYRGLVLNDDIPRPITYGDQFVSFTDADCFLTELVRFIPDKRIVALGAA